MKQDIITLPLFGKKKKLCNKDFVCHMKKQFMKWSFRLPHEKKQHYEQTVKLYLQHDTDLDM